MCELKKFKHEQGFNIDIYFLSHIVHGQVNELDAKFGLILTALLTSWP